MKLPYTLKKNKKVPVWAACSLIILAGFFCMATLEGMNEEPVQEEKEIKPLWIEVEDVRFIDYPTEIVGHGTAVCMDKAEISSLVSGQAVWVNPMSKEGQRVNAGEILFEIDPTDFRLQYKQTLAEEKEIGQNIRNLTDQFNLDKERLKNLNRSEALADAHFNRLTTLYQKNRLASAFDVEKSEMELIAARLSQKQLAKQLRLYPGQIEIENIRLESCRAKLEEIRVKLARCKIAAPLSGRINRSAVEKGMVVEKAVPVITICDEKSLEIHVPISANDLDTLTGSFDPDTLCGAECTIRRIDAVNPDRIAGHVDRIIKFNETTRTFLAAVGIGQKKSSEPPKGIHMMEGMFCEVGINGRPLTRVAKLPRKAMINDNAVFRVDDNRMEKATVTVSRIIGADIYISKGLAAGDRVVVSQVSETDSSRNIRVIGEENSDE